MYQPFCGAKDVLYIEKWWPNKDGFLTLARYKLVLHYKTTCDTSGKSNSYASMIKDLKVEAPATIAAAPVRWHQDPAAQKKPRAKRVFGAC